MGKLITICRDVHEPRSTECIDDHEGLDEPLVAPCKVALTPSVRPIAEDHVGPEAESSALFQDRSGTPDCCDC